MSSRRLLVLVVSTLVVVAALGATAAGLAVVVTTALPVALALGAALVTLVARGAARPQRRSGRRNPRERARLRWSTGWEGDPPVEAVPHTRDQVTAVLARWGLVGEAVEPTLLVVTELLSNTIDHAHGPVRLSVELSAGTVHVEVHDATPDPPRLQPPDPVRARGRGVQFVEALSIRWGWTPAPPGKIVWADVPTRWLA